MIAENLLDKIGFGAEFLEEYQRYEKVLGAKLEPYEKAYMNGEASIVKALLDIHKFKNENLSEYTLDLMFILGCSGFLLEKYKEKGISEDIFIDSMKDIKYKTIECMKVKGVFGTFVADWYDGFFKLNRIALGRLQYDIALKLEKEAEILGYTIGTDDFVLGCHIPSSGPLKHELCLESYRRAYNFFKDRIRDGVLPIVCASWLLYPPYKEVFGESSNIMDFVRDFEVLKVEESSNFSDAWRVFDTDYDGDAGKLSQKTRLQRSFVQYIMAEKPFGAGYGILLFDGEKVITRK